jgi:LacI family transcriptional regulator
VPDEVGFATLTYSPVYGEISGVDQNDEIVAAVGVELVAEQLHHNRRGVPTHPKIVMVEGEWKEGKTLRAALACETGPD